MPLTNRGIAHSVASALMLTLGVVGCDSGDAKSPNAQQSPIDPVTEQVESSPIASMAPAEEVPLESLPPEKRELERKRRAWAKVALLDPSKATLRAAGIFKVKMETTLGDVIIEVKREYAPNSIDRFYNLVLMGFYDNCQFYRVRLGGYAEFGIHPDPDVSAKWREASFEGDEFKMRNYRKSMCFTTNGKGVRSTAIVVHTASNAVLDGPNFVPFAQVIEGMENIDDLNASYGVGPPEGNGPDRDFIWDRGNAYLDEEFPGLDRIFTITLIEASRDPEFPDWVE